MTVTINLWWILTPIFVCFILTFLLTIVFALLICFNSDDKWYTFKKIAFSLSGVKLSIRWLLQDLFHIRL